MKTKTTINAKISVLVVCVEANIHLLLYNLHDFTEKVTSEASLREISWKNINFCGLKTRLLLLMKGKY